MIEYIKGDLTKMNVDAVVNAANTGLVGGAGLCGMIHDAAGPEIDEECRKIGHCLRGEAKITYGYKLPAKYVIHTVGPIYGQHSGKEPEILYSCYYESMRLADSNKLTDIAFPYISTGIYRYPKSKAKPVATRAIKDFIKDYPESTIQTVFLVDYGGEN